MEGLVAGELRIDLQLDGDSVRCVWRGRSVEREAERTLGPFFDELLSEASKSGLSLRMHFEELGYFNSSTIGSLITLIRRARTKEVRLVMIYDEALRWQRLSFDVLRMFEKSDQLFALETSS